MTPDEILNTKPFTAAPKGWHWERWDPGHLGWMLVEDGFEDDSDHHTEVVPGYSEIELVKATLQAHEELTDRVRKYINNPSFPADFQEELKVGYELEKLRTKNG